MSSQGEAGGSNELARALEDATSRLQDFQQSIQTASKSGSDLASKQKRAGFSLMGMIDRSAGMVVQGGVNVLGTQMDAKRSISSGDAAKSFAAKAMTMIPGFGDRLDSTQRAGGFVESMLAPVVRAGGDVSEEQVAALHKQFKPMFERETQLRKKIADVVGKDEGESMFEMLRELTQIVREIFDAISNFVGAGGD